MEIIYFKSSGHFLRFDIIQNDVELRINKMENYEMYIKKIQCIASMSK
jgi:hypothetical protein